MSLPHTSIFANHMKLADLAVALNKRLTNLEDAPRDIPGVIKQLSSVYDKILRLALVDVKTMAHISPGNDEAVKAQKLYQIYNKYFKFNRVDPADRAALQDMTALEAFRMRDALQFQDERAAYIERVKNYLHHLRATDISNNNFSEKRLIWPMGDWETFIEGPERSWELHIPRKIKQISKLLDFSIDPQVISDQDYLDAFVRVADLFNRAIHPCWDPVSGGEIHKNVKEYYDAQLAKISELSFLPQAKQENQQVAAPTPAA